MSETLIAEYVNADAPKHERAWRFESAPDGVIVRTFDDNGREWDKVKLMRQGAWIVLDPGAGIVKVPDAFEFLRPLIEARERATLIGLPSIAWPPVLVHSELIRQAFMLGYTPGLEQPLARGKAEFFGIRIVWDQNLDHMTRVT